MRLREIDPEKELERRRLLAIQRGDEVLYEGVPYIVTQVGSKWVHMYRKADSRQRDTVAFKSQLAKAIPMPKEASDGLSGLPAAQ
jgi:hypothetical protein